MIQREKYIEEKRWKLNYRNQYKWLTLIYGLQIGITDGTIKSDRIWRMENEVGW